MPPASSRAQEVLQERIVVIPKNGQKPTVWLFIFVLGGIVGFGFLSALIGCVMAKCCRQKRKRNQKMIEKKVADYIERAERRRNSSVSTLADNADDLVERRTANMLAIDAFAGSEQKLQANQKKAELNRTWESSSIIKPVTELKRLAVRSVMSCDTNRLPSQPENTASKSTATSTTGPLQQPERALQAPTSLRSNRDTSIDYQEPARLVEDLRSDDKTSIQR